MLGLSAVTATWGLRRLGVSRMGAGAAGVLFALCPFALYRNIGHFNMVTYLIPFPATAAVLLALDRSGTSLARPGHGWRRSPAACWSGSTTSTLRSSAPLSIAIGRSSASARAQSTDAREAWRGVSRRFVAGDDAEHDPESSWSGGSTAKPAACSTCSWSRRSTASRFATWSLRRRITGSRRSRPG